MDREPHKQLATTKWTTKQERGTHQTSHAIERRPQPHLDHFKIGGSPYHRYNILREYYPGYSVTARKEVGGSNSRLYACSISSRVSLSSGRKPPGEGERWASWKRDMRWSMVTSEAVTDWGEPLLLEDPCMMGLCCGVGCRVGCGMTLTRDVAGAGNSAQPLTRT